MSEILCVAVALAWLAILAGGWLCWQLLRQNGRILLRLDELEKRLNELEFGGDDEPEGLPLGREAPAFELPELSGERKSLAQLRGQPVLLIFFNPECGFCREMMPKLVAVQRSEDRGPKSDREQRPLPLIITTGDAGANRQLFDEHGVRWPVMLQNDGEVAKAYQANGTPAGYLVSADGKVASGLAIGAEALLKLASQPAQERPLSPALSPYNGERETTGNGGDGRADRFRQRSVARSKLKRDGLKAGTPAPDFRLPRLDGRGDLSLSDLRGRRVLLVFSSPHCGPCEALAPALEKFHRNQKNKPLTQTLSPSEGERETAKGVAVVMISRGDPKENRAKVKEHGLTFPVVLQQQWEISRRYAMFATPVAYLIDEAGIVASDVAVGVEAIQQLVVIVTSMGLAQPASA
jgi:peroxiredoxin